MADTNEQGITGRGQMRDTLIVCNALAYAILTIERLPVDQQEYSNMQDMRAMLEHIASQFLGVDYFISGARRHMDGEGFNKPTKNTDNVVTGNVVSLPKKGKPKK